MLPLMVIYLFQWETFVLIPASPQTITDWWNTSCPWTPRPPVSDTRTVCVCAHVCACVYACVCANWEQTVGDTAFMCEKLNSNCVWSLEISKGLELAQFLNDPNAVQGSSLSLLSSSGSILPVWFSENNNSPQRQSILVHTKPTNTSSSLWHLYIN